MAATDYDFQSTRNSIIERAFRLVGARDAHDTSMTGEMIAQGVQALNDMIKSWQSKRIFLWSLHRATQAVVASTASYVLPSTRPIIALDKAFITINNEDTPLELISFREYQDIEKKEDEGEPTHVALDSASGPTLYVWPTPNASYTITVTGVSKLQDWDTSNSASGFPVNWTNAITYGLASDLADEYGVSANDKLNLTAKATTFFREAAKTDREVSDEHFIEPAFPTRRR